LGVLALSSERQHAQMSKIKNGGSAQFGAEPFEHQQLGTAGVEGVKMQCKSVLELAEDVGILRRDVRGFHHGH